MKHKLETFVNFPIHDFDLTNYVANKNNSKRQLYELYALTNHYGGMGSGHYTAHIKVILKLFIFLNKKKLFSFPQPVYGLIYWDFWNLLFHCWDVLKTPGYILSLLLLIIVPEVFLIIAVSWNL